MSLWCRCARGLPTPLHRSTCSTAGPVGQCPEGGRARCGFRIISTCIVALALGVTWHAREQGERPLARDGGATPGLSSRPLSARNAS
eukprot:7370334-Alexandrium_andersonii.AAC.1